MEITEEKLRELVIKAIKEIEDSNIYKTNKCLLKKKTYVLCTEKWNDVYWNFFESLNKTEEYEVYPVICKKVESNILINNLKKFSVCKKILFEDDMNLNLIEDCITVFPVTSRNLAVKTALCIEDDFETRWIFKSIANGQRIIFLNKGLQKFTGKEPPKYVEKILNYYNTLLEFGIELKDDFFEEESKSYDDYAKSYKRYNSGSNSKEYESYNSNICGNEYHGSYSKHKRQIITEKEVGNYLSSKKIILHDNDLITEMARDKARKLNIEVERIN